MKSVEIWKPVKGFEGLYEVSDTGFVKSLPRIKINNGGRQLTKEKMLKFNNFNCEYNKVPLTDLNHRKKYYSVHRLVAQAFIPNPDNLPEVNHIDGNILNNSLDNLEWCTYGHNEKEAYRLGLKQPRLKSKPVLQIDKSGQVVHRWKNSYEPKQFGYNPANINMCCNGKRKTANGFIWRFENE